MKQGFFARKRQEHTTNFWTRFRRTLLMGDCYIKVYGDVGELTGCLVMKYRDLPPAV